MRNEYGPELAEFVDGNVIVDADEIENLLQFLANLGVDTSCTRCGDETITAVLMLPEAEKAWLMCGDCWRELPWEGFVI